MQRVSALVAGHRTLTRLATFISPEEMTRDPLFVTNRTLPEVSNTHTALARLQCNEDVDVCRAPVALDVEGGDTVMFRSMALDGPCNVSQMPPYDRAQLDAMPAAHRGWRRDREGEGDMVLDNNSAIVAALGMHNAAANPDAGGCAFVARTVRRPWPALLLAGVWLVVRLRPRRRPPAPGGRAAG
jgi:hypothetical protein